MANPIQPGFVRSAGLLAALVSCVVVSMLSACASTTTEPPQAWTSSGEAEPVPEREDTDLTTAEKGGLRLVAECDDQMFPADWATPPMSARATSLPKQYLESAIAAVQAAEAKYPTELLESVDAVYILGSLRAYGVTYGGTWSRTPRRIYVATTGEPPHWFRWNAEHLLHAEFSSILLDRYWSNLNVRAWAATNPPGFQYSGSPIAAIKAGRASNWWDTKSVRSSLLCEYSEVSLEEDFNVLASALFMGRRDLWLLYDRGGLLTRKVDLVVDFYSRIDPKFDSIFFRGLSEEHGIDADTLRAIMNAQD